jgi:hypothetical protein
VCSICIASIAFGYPKAPSGVSPDPYEKGEKDNYEKTRLLFYSKTNGKGNGKVDATGK